MCPRCAELNYGKRFQTASLDGRVALITGARVKIGYQAALHDAPGGARVIVTTRFPRDAALRFAREPDFADWRTGSQIHGLDLRHSPSVEIFAALPGSAPKDRLDILINNAAQTVRRPPASTRTCSTSRRSRFERLARPAAAAARASRGVQGRAGLRRTAARSRADATRGLGSELAAAARPALGIHRLRAALAGALRVRRRRARHARLFPAGQLDADLQQVDLRPMNSWRLTLADVPTPEMLEVQLVNAVAPFILCAS